MAQTIAMTSVEKLKGLCGIVPHLPIKQLFMDYDEQADVLYLKFKQPANIYQSHLTDDDILIEYDRENNLVGVTILDVSKRG